MSKSIRIRTTPNGDDKYIKVELKQDFDLLEILSLKIKQSDVYGNFCADHGVVAGRVIINNGFGVPNVKVSIFIPKDSNTSLLEKLYPYTSPTPSEKNVSGIRYNLLPNTQQSFDHTPVGTFPDKLSILDDETSLEIYDKYYKFTTTTNEAGDFLLLGVPTGNQILHYDMDISDIGFISSRPYELIEQGYSKELFESPFKFKKGRNLDSLAQIISANIPISVEPFWCDNLSTGRVIGITREDISIDAIELTPTAMFFGSVISDDEKDSVNKKCRPRKKMGRMDEVITSTGDIEAIYRTADGDIDSYPIEKDIIDENGTFAIQLPMQFRKVVTDEFGNLVPSPDGVKGIATEADYRFRISMDATNDDKRLRQRANFLVPNLTGNYNFNKYNRDEVKDEKPFNINQQLSTITQNTPYSADTTNQYNYLEDFQTFRWKKVYTIKQFIGRYQSTKREQSRSFIGIKDILRGSGTNKFPVNRLYDRIHPIYTIVCFLMTFIGIIIAFINGLMNIINGLVTAICNVKIICGIGITKTGCGGSLPCIGFSKRFAFLGISFTISFCRCLVFKRKCIFSKMLCKRCEDICKGPGPNEWHSCCRNPGNSNDQAHGCPENKCSTGISADDDCCGKCCGKINLIALKCPEESNTGPWKPSVIKTPFASSQCNETYIVPFSCKQCSGQSTPQIKEWVQCKLEGLATALNMLKLDFYNDWVSGVLYFPLIKRKYKVRKRKKGRGQVRKDKFCDFDCNPDYQSPLFYKKWRVKIKNTTVASKRDFTVDGCKIVLRGGYREVTNWFGEYSSDISVATLTAQAKEAALGTITFRGKDNNMNGCTLKLSDSAVQQEIANTSGIDWEYDDKEFPGPHGKPKYVKASDPLTGLEKWENVGGHAHHKNKCSTVYRVEREEYFKNEIGCPGTVDGNAQFDDPFAIVDSVPEGNETNSLYENVGDCENTGCGSECTEGVQACNRRACKCNTISQDYNKRSIRHGIIRYSDADGKLYYASQITKDDSVFNNTLNGENYKANLLYPTGIAEMGSSVFCDIDDIPFIIGDLEPTTFQVSEENLVFDSEFPTGSNPATQIINDIKDKETFFSTINLRAYMTWGCTGANCLNTPASVMQSQIGVDLLDTNDFDMEVEECFTYGIHDTDVRDYFCRRSTMYKDSQLNVHYIRPGGNDLDNVYTEYPSVSLTNTSGPLEFVYEGVTYPETFNDGDSFIPGDRCGFKNISSPIDTMYFYGAARGTNISRALSFPVNSTIDNPNPAFNLQPEEFGVKYSTSQTLYYHYFGLNPGKTALHTLVKKYFADKIDKVTLQGLGNNEKAAENVFNQPNFRNVEQNEFTVLRTCLGERQITTASANANTDGGNVGSGSGTTTNSGDVINPPSARTWNCEVVAGDPLSGTAVYDCIEKFDGSGQYSSYSGCQQFCTITTLPPDPPLPGTLPRPVYFPTTTGNCGTGLWRVELYDSYGDGWSPGCKLIVRKKVPPSYFPPITVTAFTVNPDPLIGQTGGYTAFIPADQYDRFDFIVSIPSGVNDGDEMGYEVFDTGNNLRAIKLGTNVPPTSTFDLRSDDCYNTWSTNIWKCAGSNDWTHFCGNTPQPGDPPITISDQVGPTTITTQFNSGSNPKRASWVIEVEDDTLPSTVYLTFQSHNGSGNNYELSTIGNTPYIAPNNDVVGYYGFKIETYDNVLNPNPPAGGTVEIYGKQKGNQANWSTGTLSIPPPFNIPIPGKPLGYTNTNQCNSTYGDPTQFTNSYSPLIGTDLIWGNTNATPCGFSFNNPYSYPFTLFPDSLHTYKIVIKKKGKYRIEGAIAGELFMAGSTSTTDQRTTIKIYKNEP